MKDKKEQIPEYLLRLMVLRILDSKYPGNMEYNSLEELMETKVNCFRRQLHRIVAYLDEKDYIKLEGMGSYGFGRGEFEIRYSNWLVVKIKAKGIDYLESLEEEIRLEVKKKEKELGIGFQS